MLHGQVGSAGLVSSEHLAILCLTEKSRRKYQRRARYSFVLLVESVGPWQAGLAGIGVNIPFALGEATLGLEAWLVRDWRVLQLVAHLPLLLLGLLTLLVVPESLRWLLARRHLTRARHGTSRQPQYTCLTQVAILFFT